MSSNHAYAVDPRGQRWRVISPSQDEPGFVVCSIGGWSLIPGRMASLPSDYLTPLNDAARELLDSVSAELTLMGGHDGGATNADLKELARFLEENKL